MELWEGNKLTASQRRVLITDWVGRAVQWLFTEKRGSLWKYFEGLLGLQRLSVSDRVVLLRRGHLCTVDHGVVRHSGPLRVQMMGHAKFREMEVSSLRFVIRFARGKP